MDSRFASKHIAAQWETLCRSARSSAAQLSQGCIDAAASLLNAQASRFCERPAPSTRDQLNTVYTQRMSLSARLTAIRRADAMAQAHPSVQDEILKEVATFCNGDLPGSGAAFLDLQRRNLELTAAIAALCEEGAAAAATDSK
jgi:hypothetical protein